MGCVRTERSIGLVRHELGNVPSLFDEPDEEHRLAGSPGRRRQLAFVALRYFDEAVFGEADGSKLRRLST